MRKLGGSIPGTGCIRIDLNDPSRLHLGAGGTVGPGDGIFFPRASENAGCNNHFRSQLSPSPANSELMGPRRGGGWVAAVAVDGSAAALGFVTADSAMLSAVFAEVDDSSTAGKVASDMLRSGPGSFCRASLFRRFHDVRGGGAGASPGGASSGVPGSGSEGAEVRLDRDACGRPSGMAPGAGAFVSGTSKGDESPGGGG